MVIYSVKLDQMQFLEAIKKQIKISFVVVHFTGRITQNIKTNKVKSRSVIQALIFVVNRTQKWTTLFPLSVGSGICEGGLNQFNLREQLGLARGLLSGPF